MYVGCILGSMGNTDLRGVLTQVLYFRYCVFGVLGGRFYSK
jgi:hypothetical protein